MNYDKFNISIGKIYDAMSFYLSRGYVMLDVPQIVSDSSCSVTKPKGNKSFLHLGDPYVGSAEQSFIELKKNKKLPDGKYMAITPCYRNENELNDLHLNIFLKIELIHVGELFVDEQKIISDAFDFFCKYSEPTISVEGGITDININNIEVGSYGLRKFPDGTIYAFGTGIAEPRLSYALSQK